MLKYHSISFIILYSVTAVAEPFLQNHEAHYKIVKGGIGEMIVRVQEKCTDYEITNYSDMFLITDDNPSGNQLRVNHSMRESKDGKELHFSFYSDVDGYIISERRGTAINKDSQLHVAYRNKDNENVTKIFNEIAIFPYSAYKNTLNHFDDNNKSIIQYYYDGSEDAPEFVNELMLRDDITFPDKFGIDVSKSYRVLTSFYDNMNQDDDAKFSYLNDISNTGIVNRVSVMINNINLVYELTKLHLLDKKDNC